jgi:hypothetical protein
MKYNTFPAIAEVWAAGVPTIAFEIFRIGATLKCLHHFLACNFWGIISPFVFVRLF